MPNLFFSGSLECVVSGTAAAVRDVSKAVKNAEASIGIDYDEDDTPCTFDIGQWHMISGSLEVAGIDGKTMKCKFDGTAKVPVTPSAVDFILKKKVPIKIRGVRGNGWTLTPVGQEDGIACALSIGSKAPK